MNFDYIEMTKSLDLEKPCLDYLDHQASYSSGWEKFIYEGCKDVQIWLNPEANKLKVKGSIPYFILGQNFKTGPEDFIKGIAYLSEVLALELNQSEVNVFEYGTIIETPFPVKDVFNSHLKIQGMRTRSFDYGKYFEDRVLTFKLYDANKNLKNKLSKEEREKLASLCGYESSANYLKLESHYKKPSVYFKNRFLKLADLLEPEFQTICKEELLTKYSSIMKANSIELKSKKQITSSTIPLLILKEYECLLPCKAEDLIKQKIKAFSSELLTKEDKKSRNRQIKANLKKIESVRTCKYDVSKILIKQVLSNES